MVFPLAFKSTISLGLLRALLLRAVVQASVLSPVFDNTTSLISTAHLTSPSATSSALLEAAPPMIAATVLSVSDTTSAPSMHQPAPSAPVSLPLDLQAAPSHPNSPEATHSGTASTAAQVSPSDPAPARPPVTPMPTPNLEYFNVGFRERTHERQIFCYLEDKSVQALASMFCDQTPLWKEPEPENVRPWNASFTVHREDHASYECTFRTNPEKFKTIEEAEDNAFGKITCQERSEETCQRYDLYTHTGCPKGKDGFNPQYSCAWNYMPPE